MSNKRLFAGWTRSKWILGSEYKDPTMVAWVVNFAIYKAILRAIDGYKDNLEILVQSECARYSNIFPILDTLHWPK